MIRRIDVFTLVALSLGVLGCQSREGQLADYAERSVDRQAAQNAEMAELNQEVTRTMQVLSDGQERSRQEYVELLSQIQVQQEQVAAEMTRMAVERRQLDESRKRDSEIAPILTTLGGLLLCLLPMLVVWRLLGKHRADDSQEQSLAEMLANEIVAERPILLPSPPDRRRRRSAISVRGEDGADRTSDLTTG